MTQTELHKELSMANFNRDTHDGPLYRAWKALRDAEIEIQHMLYAESVYISNLRVALDTADKTTQAIRE